MDPENPSIRRSVTDSVGVFDGELRLSCQTLVVAVQGGTVLSLPDAAQTDKCGPRTYDTFLVYLIEESLAINKVQITAEGHR